MATTKKATSTTKAKTKKVRTAKKQSSVSASSSTLEWCNINSVTSALVLLFAILCITFAIVAYMYTVA